MISRWIQSCCVRGQETTSTVVHTILNDQTQLWVETVNFLWLITGVLKLIPNFQKWNTFLLCSLIIQYELPSSKIAFKRCTLVVIFHFGGANTTPSSVISTLYCYSIGEILVLAWFSFCLRQSNFICTVRYWKCVDYCIWTYCLLANFYSLHIHLKFHREFHCFTPGDTAAVAYISFSCACFLFHLSLWWVSQEDTIFLENMFGCQGKWARMYTILSFKSQ